MQALMLFNNINATKNEKCMDNDNSIGGVLVINDVLNCNARDKLFGLFP